MMEMVITADGTGTLIQADTANLGAEIVARYADYIDRCTRTVSGYLTNLKQFFAWLKFRGIDRPDRQSVKTWRDWLGTAHRAIKWDTDSPEGWAYQTDGEGRPKTVTLKPSTIAQYLKAVKGFFGWTAQEGIYPDIAKGIHAPKVAHGHSKDALDADGVKAVGDNLTGDSETERRTRCMYLLAVTAGLRTIELERAKVRDLGIHGGQCYIRVHGKGHSEADTKVMIATAVYSEIKAYLAMRHGGAEPSSPLFTATGNRSGGKSIRARTISQMLKKAMVSAGYDSDRLTAHSLRHTAGTAVMRESGNNLYLTQRFMRHASPETTEVYLHTEHEDRHAEIAESIARMYGL